VHLLAFIYTVAFTQVHPIHKEVLFEEIAKWRDEKKGIPQL